MVNFYIIKTRKNGFVMPFYRINTMFLKFIQNRLLIKLSGVRISDGSPVKNRLDTMFKRFFLCLEIPIFFTMTIRKQSINSNAQMHSICRLSKIKYSNIRYIKSAALQNKFSASRSTAFKKIL